MEKGANSTLFIAKIKKTDGGNYTCAINSTHDFTVLVHVLNGKCETVSPVIRKMDTSCVLTVISRNGLIVLYVDEYFSLGSWLRFPVKYKWYTAMALTPIP